MARCGVTLVTGLLAASWRRAVLARGDTPHPFGQRRDRAPGRLRRAGRSRGRGRLRARTGTKPSLASDYLPRTEGWAGMVERQAPAALPGAVAGEPVPTRARRAHDPDARRAPDGDPGRRRGGRTTTANSPRWPGPSSTTGRATPSCASDGSSTAPGTRGRSRTRPTRPTSPRYFRHIVTTMRSVPGAAFRFVWNPTSGPEPEAAQNAYPGDAYVDYVGPRSLRPGVGHPHGTRAGVAPLRHRGPTACSGCPRSPPPTTSPPSSPSGA